MSFDFSFKSSSQPELLPFAYHKYLKLPFPPLGVLPLIVNREEHPPCFEIVLLLIGFSKVILILSLKEHLVLLSKIESFIFPFPAIRISKVFWYEFALVQ